MLKMVLILVFLLIISFVKKMFWMVQNTLLLLYFLKLYLMIMMFIL